MPDGSRIFGDPPSQSEGWKLLQRARSLRVEGEYWFRFELRLLPRRGPTEVVNGQMIGGWNEGGPVNRLDVQLEEARLGEDGEMIESRDRRLLLQSGLFPQAWSFEEGLDAFPKKLRNEERFQPIAGSQITPFDLQAPYLFWSRFYYVGEIKHRSRSTHVFWMYPPEEDEYLSEQIGGVKIYIDEEFLYTIQSEIYDTESKHLKTISLLQFKKTDGEWFVKSIDVRDEETRNKTRFKVESADMDVDLADEALSPEGLERALPELALRHSLPSVP